MKRFVVLLFILVACNPELPNAADITPVTAVPTLQASTLCLIAEETGSWETRIETLENLAERREDCGAEIGLSLYLAYLGYGESLEIMGDTAGALEAYETALSYAPNAYEAQQRIARLNN